MTESFPRPDPTPLVIKKWERDLHAVVDELEQDCLKEDEEINPPSDFDTISLNGVPISSFVDLFIKPLPRERFNVNPNHLNKNEEIGKIIEKVQEYLNEKPYIIFKDGVSAQQMEEIRDTLKDNRIYSYENNKLRINNITVCLDYLGKLLEYLKAILGSEVASEIIEKMKWSKFTKVATKNTQRIWKKEQQGPRISSVSGNNDIPWDTVYEIYHQSTEHFIRVEQGKAEGMPKVELFGEPFEVDEETLEEVFRLVHSDDQTSKFNVDFKLHFLRDKSIGLVPNARRILGLLDIVLILSSNGDNQLGDAEYILEQFHNSFDIKNS